MKGWAAAGIVALIITLESVAIIIALVGAIAGVIALLVVLSNARNIETFVDQQTRAVKTLKERVDALEPPRPAG